MSLQPFRKVRTEERPCARCGSTTEHVKVGADFSIHWFLTFLTFLVWSPVHLLCYLLDVVTPWRCSRCESRAASRKEVRTPGAHP